MLLSDSRVLPAASRTGECCFLGAEAVTHAGCPYAQPDWVLQHQVSEGLKLPRQALTMSVPKSMQRMVTVPSGSGMFAIINIRKGVISGMLLVRV